MASLEEIDRLILACAKPRLQKVAMIIGKVSLENGIVATRIGALVADGKLGSVGNIELLRHSEVRLKEL